MDSTHIRWLEESLENSTVQKILKAEKWKNRKSQREHDRKEEPKIAPVVPNRRGRPLIS
jgi:hypothetical protein